MQSDYFNRAEIVLAKSVALSAINVSETWQPHFQDLQPLPAAFGMWSSMLMNMLYCALLIFKVKDNLISLSTQKFSSNVVEKVIDVAPAEDLRDIINQLAETTVVATLVYSSYGNFVVQKVRLVGTHTHVTMWSIC